MVRSVRLLLLCLLGGAVVAITLSTIDTVTGRPAPLAFWLPAGALWALAMWAVFRRAAAHGGSAAERRSATFVLPLSRDTALARAESALRRLGCRRITVRSDSWPFTPLYDWDVNRRNVEAVLAAMRRDVEG